MLGNASRRRAAWTARGRRRAARPSTATCGTSRTGLYLDYDFAHAAGGASTRSPPRSIRCGRGSPRRRRRARVRDNLTLFERPGGLLTSTRVTGNQWDAPFGWAPAADDPGAGPAALRLRRRRRPRVAQVPRPRHQGVRGARHHRGEVRRAAPRVRRVGRHHASATAANEIGFGWTNAAYLDLLAGLSGTSGPEPPAAPRPVSAPAPAPAPGR